jgi:translation elongation factor P/translation initiation factor 5A
MKKIAVILFLVFFSAAQAQLNQKIIGKWKLNPTVFTEFTTTETANKQVVDNKAKYAYLENSSWTFMKEGKFEAKLTNGTIEKGSYSANEDRFIIIFDKEEIEEFNTAIVTVETTKVSITMGRGMTRLQFDFSKK